MSDIIQRTKKALEGTTPGPWELYGGEIHQIQHTPEQCTSFRCDHRWPVLSESWGESAAVAAEDEDLALMAAAPEMAQALAEETWEYGVEYKYLTNRGAEWRLDLSAGWHKAYRDAERAARTSVQFRIVRRRVSPPEVINE